MSSIVLPSTAHVTKILEDSYTDSMRIKLKNHLEKCAKEYIEQEVAKCAVRVHAKAEGMSDLLILSIAIEVKD